MQIPPLPEPPPAIVITAPALPDPAVEQAFSIMVIGRARLRNAPTSQLDQLLKAVPGLQLFRRSDARSAHPTSQGVTLRGLGGNAASRALLNLDGVPQADPFGGWVNWPAYDPASLAEIRVVRGGGSVASGPGALAGVIEMRSARTPGISASAEVGSRGSAEGRVGGGFALGGGTVGLWARAARGDGFIPIVPEDRGDADRAAPYDQASLRAYWVAPLTAGIDVQLSGLGFMDRRTRGLAFTGNRSHGADASIRLVGRGSWAWTALAYGQARELRSSFASINAGRSTATRVSLQDSVPSSALGASFEVRPPLGSGIQARLGGDGRLAEGESRELYSFVDGEPTRRRLAGGQTLTAGLFAEATVDVGAISLSGGVRLDRWRIMDGELFEKTIATGAQLRNDRHADRGGELPTARMSAVLDLDAGLSVAAAAYRGWRLPTLNELFRPFRAGADATAANPLLDPERLAGFDLGVRYRRKGLSFSATGFFNRVKDSIANVTLGRGPGTFPGVGFVAGEYRQRQNVDAVRVRGLELSAEMSRGPLTVSAAASLTGPKVVSSGSAAALNGLRPAQTPQLALTGSVAWERNGRSLALTVRHVGPQFEDDLNQDELRSATTVDAFAAWPVQRTIALFVRAENLLDERVEAGIGNDRSVERATPQTLSVGLRFSRPAGSP